MCRRRSLRNLGWPRRPAGARLTSESSTRSSSRTSTICPPYMNHYPSFPSWPSLFLGIDLFGNQTLISAGFATSRNLPMKLDSIPTLFWTLSDIILLLREVRLVSGNRQTQFPKVLGGSFHCIFQGIRDERLNSIRN